WRSVPASAGKATTTASGYSPRLAAVNGLQAAAGGLRCSFRWLVVGPDGALDLDAQGANLRAQAAAGDAEDLRCLHLIPGGMPQHVREQRPLHQCQRLGMEILRTGGDALLDEVVPTG